MKKTTKLVSIVLALVLALALSVTAYAATVTKADGVSGPASITVQLPEVPDGATANNTYKIYKVFDAALSADGAGISYTLVPGKTTPPAGFVVDGAGNVTYAGAAGTQTLAAADIAAIKAYVNDADVVATVNTTAEDESFTVDGLPYGYYYIDTTTGTLITVDSTHPEAVVSDKNEIPGVDKKITGASSIDEDGKKALAEIGTTVEYTASITKEAGAENYKFHDKMSDGLAYNGDIKVYVNGAQVSAGATTFTIGADAGDTITVSFDNGYIGGLADGTVIEFKYSATVTSDALTRDPANNTCYLSYGDVNGENHTPPEQTEVYNAKITVKKTDDAGKPLANAKFVLQNSNGLYYKLVSGAVQWTDLANADVHESDAQGNVAPFTGLCNGTYTLIETEAPSGYNKAADQTFTIAEHDYTVSNLEQDATVVNEEGPELPSTGGMGTTILYIIGAVLVLGAAVVIVARKKVRQ